MKVVILAGGLGSRISEESHLRPKPMIEIGGMPILWHILKIYSNYGFNDFIICAGYKQHIIKQYFSEYYLRTSDVTFNFANNNQVTIHRASVEPWRLTIVDTGLNTMTGGRLGRIREYLTEDEFMLTYGDAVSDVDILKLLDFHHRHNRAATITTVQPGGRFGSVDIDQNGTIRRFAEKTKESGGWINAGFMVLSQAVFDFISGDECILEKDPLEQLANKGMLGAYKHYGFWQCMDTLKERNYLERLWQEGIAPWKLWR